MRIRKRFPSYRIVPSSVASSTGAPTQHEEMEVTSYPKTSAGEGTAKRDVVLTDWQPIKKRAHGLLLSGSSSTSNNNRLGAQDAHSSTGPVRDINGRNKSPLVQENPTQTMVIEQGDGNVGKQTLDHFSDSQKKGKYIRTGLNRRARTVPSSSWKGITAVDSEDRKLEIPLKFTKTKPRTKRVCVNDIIAADSEDRKLESPLRFTVTKPRTKRVRINRRSLRKSENKVEGEDEDENEAKIRRFRDIYADVRSIMRVNWPAKKRRMLTGSH